MLDEKQESRETIPEIVTEMRHGLNRSWHEIDREWAHDLADRIEAAHEREKSACRRMEEVAKSAIGNETAMRKTLKWILSVFEDVYNRGELLSVSFEDIRKIRNALDMPPRNCDRFNSGIPSNDRKAAQEAILRECGDKIPLEWILSPVKKRDAES